VPLLPILLEQANYFECSYFWDDKCRGGKLITP